MIHKLGKEDMENSQINSKILHLKKKYSVTCTASFKYRLGREDTCSTILTFLRTDVTFLKITKHCSTVLPGLRDRVMFCGFTFTSEPSGLSCKQH